MDVDAMPLHFTIKPLYYLNFFCARHWTLQMLAICQSQKSIVEHDADQHMSLIQPQKVLNFWSFLAA